MQGQLPKKAFLGLGRWLIPLPLFLVRNNMRSSGKLICRETADITPEERKVHFYVVKQVTDTNLPVSPEQIAADLDIPLERVVQIIDRLESLKVFFYRYNNSAINWAYPVTSDQRDFRLKYNSGKECTAAWAADAVANPFVQGRLRNKALTMEIDTRCAVSGRPIRIEFDSDLNLIKRDPECDPLISIPMVNIIKTRKPSIVDIF